MDALRGAAKLLQTGAANIGSGVEAAGRGLGRIWTKISPGEASGSASKAMAAAKQLAETPISRPFNVVPQRSNLESEGTQQAKAPTEQKTLSEKREAIETSIKGAEKKLFDFEDAYRGKNKDAAYNEQHNQLNTDIANLKDQLADIKEEIRRNS